MSQEEWNIETPEHVSIRVRLAGLGSRAAALIIDTALITLIYIGLGAVLLFFENNLRVFFYERGSILLAIALLIIFLVNWGYFFFTEWLAGGKTLGKRLLGIRVVDDQGGSPTTLSILVRNLLRVVDMLPAYYLLGMIMVFSHPKHKRLGDLMGGTLVVYDGHKKRKESKLEKEIQKRVIEAFPEETLTLHAFQKKEWNLLKTYVNRFFTMSSSQRKAVTYEVANLLFPKVGIDVVGKDEQELEDDLLRLYITVREEWQITPF
ncbi:RDD family protein [Halobacillus salinus]|uniref:RDD family protein n=1 Tax=Halobacillus salinus TaxID=192814 RepID=UPI0009A8E56A|nr:RDD family protein [Halobacillus salinus]